MLIADRFFFRVFRRLDNPAPLVYIDIALALESAEC